MTIAIVHSLVMRLKQHVGRSCLFALLKQKMGCSVAKHLRDNPMRSLSCSAKGDFVFLLGAKKIKVHPWKYIYTCRKQIVKKRRMIQG